MDTTELISTRHDCLSFAPEYRKGLSLKLWTFHKQKVSIALELLDSVEVMDTIDILKKHFMSEEKENKGHCEGRLQLPLLPHLPLIASNGHCG